MVGCDFEQELIIATHVLVVWSRTDPEFGFVRNGNYRLTETVIAFRQVSQRKITAKTSHYRLFIVLTAYWPLALALQVLTPPKN